MTTAQDEASAKTERLAIHRHPGEKRVDEWAALGALRFVLALDVAAQHLTGVQLGSIEAVLGFFAVSGYSIAASMERDSATGRFYARRALRIYPVMWAGLALAAGVYFTRGATVSGLGYASLNGPTLKVFLGNALGLQGFFCHPLEYNLPLWTLSVEMSYYLAAPLLWRMSRRAVYGLLAALVGAAVWHCCFSKVMYFNELFGIGSVCMAWAWVIGWIVRRYRGGVGLAVVLPAFMASFDPYYHSYAASFVIAVSGVTLVSARTLLIPTKAGAWLKWLGELSYPIYVVHWPVALLLGKASSAVMLGVTMVTAAAVYYLADLPVRRLRLASPR